jgi:hypothetical protein
MKDGKQKFTIFTEYRCTNPVEGGKVCGECSTKLPMYKYQANQKCDHGFVGGPYPKDSKLYGSPYYLNCIKNGCTISEVDEQRAKEAMIKAGSEMPKKTAATNAVVDTVTTVTAPITAPVAAPVKPEKKIKKVLKVKTSIPVLETPVTEVIAANTVAPVKPTMVESTEPPLVVEDIIRVRVKKIRHQGKDYYFDGNSAKLYHATKDGVGKYAGRYNEETATINTSYPDSDEE